MAVLGGLLIFWGCMADLAAGIIRKFDFLFSSFRWQDWRFSTSILVHLWRHWPGLLAKKTKTKLFCGFELPNTPNSRQMSQDGAPEPLS
jgi:hypothetical protein